MITYRRFSRLTILIIASSIITYLAFFGFFAVKTAFVDHEFGTAVGFSAFALLGIVIFVSLYKEADKNLYLITKKGIIGERRSTREETKWSEIQFIGFYNYPIWLPFKMLIISKNKDRQLLCRRPLSKQEVNDSIFIEYRPTILEEIKQYWPDEILYEERYVKKKRAIKSKGLKKIRPFSF